MVIDTSRLVSDIFKREGRLLLLWTILYSLLETLGPLALNYALKTLEQGGFSFLLLIITPLCTIIAFVTHRYLRQLLGEKTSSKLRSVLYKEVISNGNASPHLLHCFTEDTLFAGKIWSRVYLRVTPFFLVLSFYFMWRFIGIASVVGFSFCFLGVFFLKRLESLYEQYHRLTQKMGQRLTSFLSSIFANLSLIQSMELAEPLLKQARQMRQSQDARTHYRKARVRSDLHFVQMCIALGAPILSFGTYLLIESEPALSDIFSAFVLLGIIQYHLLHLQKGLLESREGKIALERLNALFTSLKSPSLPLPKEGLTVVLGPNAEKNRLYLKSHFESLVVNKRVGWSGAMPWIWDGSVLDNILCFQALEQERLNHILEVCELKHDIASWPEGLQKKTGPDGSHLSFGQKKRVELARLLYHKHEWTILDNPVDGLNEQVASKIIQKGILPSFSHCIIHSSHPELLKAADQIILIDEGVHYFNDEKTLRTYPSSFCAQVSQTAFSFENNFAKNSESTQQEKPTPAKQHKKSQEEMPSLFKSLHNYINLMASSRLALLLACFLPAFFFLSSNVWLSQYNRWKEVLPNWGIVIYFTLGACACGALFFLYRFFFKRSVTSSTTSFGSLIEHLLDLRATHLHQNMVQTLTYDTSRLTDGLPATFLRLSDLFFLTLLSLALILTGMPFLAIPAVFLGLCCTYFYRKQAPQLLMYLNSLAKIRLRQIVLFQEAEKGQKTLQGLKINAPLLGRYEKYEKMFCRYCQARLRLTSILWFSLESIGIALLTIVLLTLQYLPLHFDPGFITLVISGVFMITQQGALLALFSSDFHAESQSLQRLLDWKERKNEEHIHTKSCPPFFKKGLVIENIEVGHATSPSIFKKMSLELKAGECVGIVGRTGQGKSTFLHMLNRTLTPTSGQIFWDEENLSSFSHASFRRHVCFVPDTIVIGHLTVRAFINREGKWKDPHLNKVLERLQLSLTLTQRLETLADFEKQLICLARAFLEPKPLILIDEPKTHENPQGCAKFKNVIYKELKGTLRIIVSHDEAFLKECDRCYQVHNGTLNKIF